MTLHTYNGEIFERNKRWYVFFALMIISIVWLSLWKQNVVGVVVLFIILWAYFYYNIISNQHIEIKIEKDFLLIHQKKYARSSFKWYNLEIEKKSEKVKNLILITERWHVIYTIDDSKENIKNFIVELNNRIPLTGEYMQTSLEKLARILKL